MAELRIPPGNRQEKLSGIRSEQLSVRINSLWRICFVWRDGHVWEVEIVAGKRSVTADTGLRLSRLFGMNDSFWIGLQADYDMANARESLGSKLARITRFDPVHA